MVQDLLEEGRGDVLAESDAPNFSCQHEPNFATAHFFVQLHRLLQVVALNFREPQLGWKTGAPEKFGDSVNLRRPQSKSTGGEARCGHLADRNRFPRKLSAVAGYRL